MNGNNVVTTTFIFTLCLDSRFCTHFILTQFILSTNFMRNILSWIWNIIEEVHIYATSLSLPIPKNKNKNIHFSFVF